MPLPQRTIDARRRLYASDSQRAYLRRLLAQAFAQRVEHPYNLDPHHLDNTTRAYAVEAIDGLRQRLGIGGVK